MQINVTTNLPAVQRFLATAQKQGRFALSVALTRTAQDVQRAVPAALDRSLDNPTEFTKRGTYVVPARKDRLQATVGFKDRQARYMALQIAGGVRRPGTIGIKLPGNIQLNSFGNIPRGVINRLKAAAKDGSLGTTLAKRINANGNRRKGAAAVQLFLGKPTGKGWEKAPMGIWRRIPPAVPGGVGKLVPVVVFEDTPARYSRRFDFEALARRTVATRFADHFQAEYRKALASAR